MGTCYSRQGQLYIKDPLPLKTADTADNMPHMMKSSNPEPPPSDDVAIPDKRSGGFGFKRSPPKEHHTSKNSNEQSDRDRDRTTLGTITNSDKHKSNGSGRFGFKGMGRKDKAKKGQLPMSPSSDSVQSARSHDNDAQVKRPGRSGSLPSSRQSSLRKAYIPRSNTGSWRMIDDASSVYSGVSARPSDRTCPSDTTPALSTDDLDNGNSAASTPVKSTAAILLKAPIAAVESLETLSSGDDPKSRGPPPQIRSSQQTCLTAYGNHGNTDKGQSRLKGPFKKSGRPTSGVTSTKPSPPGQKQVNHGDHTQSKGKGSKNNGSSFLKKGFLRKQKPAEENNTVSKASETCKRPEASRGQGKKAETPVNKTCGSEPVSRNPGSAHVSSGSAESKKGSLKPHLEEQSKAVIEEAIVCETETSVAGAPASRQDVTDSGSIDSEHTEDLMADTEQFTNHDLSGASAVPDKSCRGGRSRTRSRSGSRSRSYERPGDDICHRADKVASGKKGSDPRLPSLKREGSTEPLDELASLVEANTGSAAQRRQQRLQRAPRPVSFPGPRSRGSSVTDNGTDQPASHGGSLSLKPPRQGSLHADDEQISIDGFTYRHLVQDVTTFKTMLLKLKRLIQEEEFQGQSWKNGFKLSSSQPTSPFDDTNKFNFASLLETEEGIPNPGCVDDVVKENLDLKQQNVFLQHQLEEQERTIKLLQQQMTKYECGYSEPSGKAYTHISTQTDRQMSGFYKSTGSYRTACVRRTSSSSSSHQGAPRYRTEFRASGRSSNTAPPLNDEVFLETMSCDNDDDLDLLMEEVSLGSDVGSVGDSHFGGSFRGSSVSSYVLPLEGRESALSHISRDCSLSHSVGHSSSRMNRDHSLSHSAGPSSSHSYRAYDSLERSHDGCHSDQSVPAVIDNFGNSHKRRESLDTINTNCNNRAGEQAPSPEERSALSSDMLGQSFNTEQGHDDKNILTFGLPGDISVRHSPEGSTSRSVHSPSGLPCHSPEGGTSPQEHSSGDHHDDMKSDGESGFGTGEPNEMLAIRESLVDNFSPEIVQMTNSGGYNEETTSPKHVLTKQDHVMSDIRDITEQNQTQTIIESSHHTATPEHTLPPDHSGPPDQTRPPAQIPPPDQNLALNRSMSPAHPGPRDELSTAAPAGRSLRKSHTAPSGAWSLNSQSESHEASNRGGHNFAFHGHPHKSTKPPYRPGHAVSQDRGLGLLKPPTKSVYSAPSHSHPSHPRSGITPMESQTSTAAKKRRQLPTLAAVTHTDIRSSGLSRLPKPPSAGNLRTTTAPSSVRNTNTTTRGRPYVK